MNIFIYSDESGVFDKEHNDIFVFGGLIMIGSDAKERWSHLYSAAERAIRSAGKRDGNCELKATKLSNGEKTKLFRSLNNCYKFGVIIRQKELLARIFASKKDKQRFLDYAFKIAVKRAFENLMSRKIINPFDIDRLHFYVDEHSTATNGRYELKEGLEQEFKGGTFNYNYGRFFPPLFPSLTSVDLEFCNSASRLLIRASDIVANRIYHEAQKNKNFIARTDKLYIINLP